MTRPNGRVKNWGAFDTTFSGHLSDLRKERDLLQKDAAKETGAALRAYQRYEYGERETQLPVLVVPAETD